MQRVEKNRVHGRKSPGIKTFLRRLSAGLLAAGMLAFPVQAQEDAVSAQGEPISVGAKAAIVIELESGRVLYEQNIRERLPMASTTKIMTTMLTLEQENLDEEFTVDPQAIQVEGSSMGLVEGDIVTLRALAYGMILPSGNDAANSAAVRIAGSQEAFVRLMNERAQEMGLVDTAFVTPSGLDADGHYSTAYDMAMLTRAAMQNPEFCEICKLYRAQVKFGNPPQERWLKNHNKLIEMYDGCIGVKTGFTDNARRCLVSAATRDGVTLVCVTLNAPDDWAIHSSLYDRAFASLKRRSLSELLPQEMKLDVTGGNKTQVPVQCAWEPMASVSQGEYERLQVKVSLQKLEFAPVVAGQTVGTAEFYLDDTCLTKVPLTAGEEVAGITKPKKSFWEWLGSLFGG